MYIADDPLPCGQISRAVFITMSLQKHAATFQGWWDFEVWRHFEETRYVSLLPTGPTDSTIIGLWSSWGRAILLKVPKSSTIKATVICHRIMLRHVPSGCQHSHLFGKL